MEIVISHIKDNDFEEVIDCLENSNVIVYDKSGVYKNDKYRIISKLQNLGDEGETYLTHIINNYDNLEDYTLFIQDGISACAEDLTNFKEVTTNMINTNRRVHFYSTSMKHNNVLIKGGYATIFCNKTNPLQSIIKHKFTLRTACKELNIWIPTWYKANVFVSFLASKRSIKGRPIEFYVKLREWYMKNEINNVILRLLWPLILQDKMQLEYESSMYFKSQMHNNI
jgi:hypothetical protein